MESIPPRFFVRPVKTRSGKEYGWILGASGPAGLAHIKDNLGLLNTDRAVQLELTGRMDSFAQEVRRFLIEGGAISYPGGKIDFGFRNSSYLVEDEMLVRLREEWVIGLYEKRGRYGLRQDKANPWRILVQQGTDQVLVPLLREPGHHLTFSLFAERSTRLAHLDQEQALAHLIGGALVNYAGLFIPKAQFPRRVSGSTLAKAAVLDAIPIGRRSI